MQDTNLRIVYHLKLPWQIKHQYFHNRRSCACDQEDSETLSLKKVRCDSTIITVLAWILSIGFGGDGYVWGDDAMKLSTYLLRMCSGAVVHKLIKSYTSKSAWLQRIMISNNQQNRNNLINQNSQKEGTSKSSSSESRWLPRMDCWTWEAEPDVYGVRDERAVSFGGNLCTGKGLLFVTPNNGSVNQPSLWGHLLHYLSHLARNGRVQWSSSHLETLVSTH